MYSRSFVSQSARSTKGRFPSIKCSTAHRRGVAIVQMAVALPMLLSFGALTVDIGRLYMAKNQLQVAADSAAMAGASAYLTDSGLASTLSDVLRRNDSEVHAAVRDRARNFSYRNTTFGDGTHLETSDVVLGTYDFDNPNTPLDTSGARPFNAVQVSVRRTEGSTNGPVDFFFARIFGRKKGGVTATATAVIDDRFAGYNPFEQGAMPLIPVAVHEDVYEYLLGNGPDGFDYNEPDVEPSADGLNEVVLFPWKLSGSTQPLLAELEVDLSGEGSGNFGYLDFAGSSNTGELSAQINSGLSQSQIYQTIGEDKFRFVQPDGGANTYTLSGAPGLKAGTEDAFDSRIGDVVGFFLFDRVTGNGTNTTYRITGIRFGRVMEVELNSHMRDKRIVVQPVAYGGAGLWIDERAPSSVGQAGKVVLVR